MALIDNKSLSSADKMFYLKKYVSGSARKAVEGTFFRTDDEAYQDAWCKLNGRYGQPFVIHAVTLSVGQLELLNSDTGRELRHIISSMTLDACGRD